MNCDGPNVTLFTCIFSHILRADTQELAKAPHAALWDHFPPSIIRPATAIRPNQPVNQPSQRTNPAATNQNQNFPQGGLNNPTQPPHQMADNQFLSQAPTPSQGRGRGRGQNFRGTQNHRGPRGSWAGRSGRGRGRGRGNTLRTLLNLLTQ